jgi:hypothetical protein
MRRLLMAVAVAALVAGAGFAYLQHAQPEWWVRLRHPLEYRVEIVGYGHIYHLDPALVAAVIYEESRFHPDTRSSAGAIGLMQLLPSTARGIAEHTTGDSPPKVAVTCPLHFGAGTVPRRDRSVRQIRGSDGGETTPGPHQPSMPTTRADATLARPSQPTVVRRWGRRPRRR